MVPDPHISVPGHGARSRDVGLSAVWAGRSGPRIVVHSGESGGQFRIKFGFGFHADDDFCCLQFIPPSILTL